MKLLNRYKYYSAKEILKMNAQYNLVIGERSNGKTYCLLNMALENWIKKRKKTGYIRRWAEDLKGKRGRVIFDGLIANGVISKLTNGEWDRIYYYSKTWYLAKWDEDLKKLVYDTEPFMYGFALSVILSSLSFNVILVTSFLLFCYFSWDFIITHVNIIHNR